jgi:hypothetical protein
MNNFTQEKIVDQDDNIILCEESNRTIIYDKDSKEVIFKYFPYSKIKNIQDFYHGKVSHKGVAGAVPHQRPVDSQPEDLSKYHIFLAHEGIIISIFWYKKWYIIKNKKLNIFTSRWVAKQKTFGEQFFKMIYDCIDEDLIDLPHEDMKNYLDNVFEKNLEQNKKYFFLLEPNSEERNVVKLDKPKLLFLASIENEKFNFQEMITLNNSIIEKPQQFSFNSIEKFEEELNNLDYLKNQGFIVIEKGQENIIHYKIFNPKYFYYFNLRNNIPSLSFRFLQLYTTYCKDKKNESLQNLKDFCHFYDFDHKKTLVLIWKICNILCGLYHEKFIKKKDIPIPNKTNNFLKLIHSHYQKDHLYTSKEKILSIIEKSHPVKINHLIKEQQQLMKEQEKMTTHSTVRSAAHEDACEKTLKSLKACATSSLV